MVVGRFSPAARLTVLALIASVAAAFVLAGCGSSSSNSSASNQVARAAFVSTSSAGYRMRFGMVLSTSALPTPITAVGTGSFNVHQHAGEIALSMNFGNIPQIASVLGSSTFLLREVINGTVVYIKFPDALASRLPSLSGKPWVKIDIAKAASAAGVPGIGSLVNNPASSDPSQFLQYLRAAGTVSKVGTDTVNGVSTTHYRATIDLDKVPNTLPAAQQGQAKTAIAGLEKLTNLHRIPVGVWIDSQDLVRRMRMAFKESLSGGQSVSTAITVDIVQYGPQPPPVVPPASQVTDASALAGATG